MAHHRNEDRLARLYDLFATGQFAAVLSMCADDITFTVPGKTPFSGIQTKATFQNWIEQVWSISEGSFREIPYRIIANDQHGVVLLDHYLTRQGREIHYRVSHIWQIRDDLFSAWEEWPGDEDAFTAAWT